MKPLLQWSCTDLNDGWVMIGVDVDLSGPGNLECLMGLRRAVHPAHFEDAANPVIAFTAVITEMDSMIRRGCGVGAEPHSASRAHAFGRAGKLKVKAGVSGPIHPRPTLEP